MNQAERPLVHQKHKCPYCNRDIELGSPDIMIKHINDDHGLLLITKQHTRDYQKEYPQFLWTPSDGLAQLCCPSCMFITHEGDHQGLSNHFWAECHIIQLGQVLPKVVPDLLPAAAPAAIPPVVGAIEHANLQQAPQAPPDENPVPDLPPPAIRRLEEDTRQLWNWDHIPSQQVRERLEAIAAANNPAFIRRNPYWESELEEIRLNNKPHLFHDYQEEFPDIYRDGSDEE